MADFLEQNLKAILKDGEEVLWSGSPVATAKTLFRKNKMEETLYVITNTRLLIIRKNVKAYSTVKLDLCKKVQFYTDNDGNVSFLVGFRTDNPTKKKTMAYAVNEPWMEPAYTECEGFAMYALPNKGEDFKETISKFLNF